MTTKTTVRRNLLRRATGLVVVDDEAYRWVGSKREVYGYLRKRGVARGYDYSANLPNVAAMGASAYDALCAATRCITATHGACACDYSGDPFEFIDAIEQRGAVTLYVR